MNLVLTNQFWDRYGLQRDEWAILDCENPALLLNQIRLSTDIGQIRPKFTLFANHFEFFSYRSRRTNTKIGVLSLAAKSVSGYSQIDLQKTGGGGRKKCLKSRVK
jgi:hypothetical protein